MSACVDCGRPAMFEDAYCQTCGRRADERVARELETLCAECGAPDARTRGPADDPGDPFCDACDRRYVMDAEADHAEMLHRAVYWQP